MRNRHRTIYSATGQSYGHYYALRASRPTSQRLRPRQAQERKRQVLLSWVGRGVVGEADWMHMELWFGFSPLIPNFLLLLLHPYYQRYWNSHFESTYSANVGAQLTSAISTALPSTSRHTSTIEANSQLHTSGSETNSQPHTGGLGNGAKAGIGVGVAAGVLATLLVGAFVFLKRRKAMLGGGSITTTQELDSVPVLEQKIQEAPGLPVHTSSQISELEAKPLR